MLITPSFKKSLIVEQFQGNYLNAFSVFKYLWRSVWGPGLHVQDIAKINYNLLYQEIPATLVFEISDDGSYTWIKREHYKGQEDT